MGCPPPDDVGSTKSRELYGNRVTALGKGRPTAPGNSGHRSVTSPAPISAMQIPSNGNDIQSSVLSASDSTSHTVSPSTPSSGPTDKSDEAQQNPAECTNCHSENSTRGADTRLGASPETDSGPSDPVTSTMKTTESTVSPVNSPSSAGPAVTNLSPGEPPELVSCPQKPISSEIIPTHVEDLDLSVFHQGQATPLSVGSHQGRLAIAKPTMSTVRARSTISEVPGKEAVTSPPSFQPDRTTQNDSLTAPLGPTEKSKGDTSPSLSNAPIPTTKTDPPSTSSVAFPYSASVNTHSIIGDFKDSMRMPLPPATEASRRSFSAVVHRNDSDKRSDSSHSTASKTSTITSRPSSASFKPGTDGGVVRSKRNFKHLGAVTADPPADPLVSSGVGDLAALLQDAAWLEQRLSDPNTGLDIPPPRGDGGSKAESGPVPLSTTEAKEKSTQPVSAAATTTRSKGRGLTLGPLSPIVSKTPSFQVHPAASGSPEEVLPIPPKSARGRKYFSLRGALRGSRLSMSSEMSSDDSAPVATPPSPTFDLSMQQATQGHGNDSMSVRSMFSSRSNKSGKSESVPGSLRLSPRRSVARASSFAERLLNRATKTKSILDDPGERTR